MEKFEIQIKGEPGPPQVIVAERIVERDGAWLFYDDAGDPVGMVELKAAASIFSTEMVQPIEEPPEHRSSTDESP